jgi:hypothetical protein
VRFEPVGQHRWNAIFKEYDSCRFMWTSHISSFAVIPLDSELVPRLTVHFSHGSRGGCSKGLQKQWKNVEASDGSFSNGLQN